MSTVFRADVAVVAAVVVVVRLVWFKQNVFIHRNHKLSKQVQKAQ